MEEIFPLSLNKSRKIDHLIMHRICCLSTIKSLLRLKMTLLKFFEFYPLIEHLIVKGRNYFEEGNSHKYIMDDNLSLYLEAKKRLEEELT